MMTSQRATQVIRDVRYGPYWAKLSQCGTNLKLEDMFSERFDSSSESVLKTYLHKFTYSSYLVSIWPYLDPNLIFLFLIQSRGMMRKSKRSSGHYSVNLLLYSSIIHHGHSLTFMKQIIASSQSKNY